MNITIADREFRYAGIDAEIYSHKFLCDEEAFYIGRSDRKLSNSEARDLLIKELIKSEREAAVDRYRADEYCAKVAVFDASGKLTLNDIGLLHVPNLEQYRTNVLDVEEWSETLSATHAKIIRGASAITNGKDMLDISFEDGTPSPWSIQLSLEQCDRLIAKENSGCEMILSVWMLRDDKPSKVKELKAKYQDLR